MSRRSYTRLIWVAGSVFLTGLVWIASGVTPQHANAASELIVTPAPPKPSQHAVVPSPPPPPNLETFTAEVRPGDNLSTIFHRHGLAARDLHLLVESGQLGKRLAKLYPGYEIEFGRDAERNLVHLEYRPGPWETVKFQRVGDEFEGSSKVNEPDAVRNYAHATIDHSLFRACQRAGLGDAFAQRLEGVFKWDIDMFLDIRKGDEFHVLYEEQQLDGEFMGFGAILAAEFVNQDRSYKAVRYIDSAGNASYYSPTGENLRKVFLRAPLEFSRISSTFSRNRLHPLWKRMMPHLGIDYAAPSGTPVKAAGAGVVTARSKSSSKGNYIVIKHGERYQTKYLHLSRFAPGIALGTRVDQGRVIGYVGATGWATGPHLHYEFLVDGVHTNPSRVALPPAEPIDAAERERFDASTSALLGSLASHKKDRQLAYLSPLLPSGED
ncbi:MAG: peptidoglycan DD-metalloendopeptidase family protein [Gammaproteobacteria bacterium]|nr:peptidoglycan DD-metalloendopeptidase family protein [Gammaproteobacteria bacterium]